MKSYKLNMAAAAFSCLGMLLTPAVQAAPTAAPRDVALQSGGVLLGQVVDAQGAPLAKSSVSIRVAGKEAARALTDQSGKFAVPNLKGGVYEVASVGHADIYRCWAPGTAPPAAQHGLMLVSNNDLIRAQNCGSGVACGSGVGCGSGCGAGGGGLLGWMANHPVITAGAIGAAIAIPLALDDDDPMSP
jgi:hypothetical protein